MKLVLTFVHISIYGYVRMPKKWLFCPVVSTTPSKPHLLLFCLVVVTTLWEIYA